MIININKPAGITSHDVVDVVRRITGERRVGHAGTLDPFATGVLIVGVTREGTKQLGEISKNTEKEYRATLCLGKMSSTGDLTGEIREGGDPSSLTRKQIENVLSTFRGESEQVPPAFSAIKINGTPAYKLARKGQRVELQPRKIFIHTLELVDFESPYLTITVTCSSGTYIRTLAEDIGKKLNVGAYLTELTRTRVGTFQLAESISLSDLHQEKGL